MSKSLPVEGGELDRVDYTEDSSFRYLNTPPAFDNDYYHQTSLEYELPVVPKVNKYKGQSLTGSEHPSSNKWTANEKILIIVASLAVVYLLSR